jgi:hypothetical protein
MSCNCHDCRFAGDDYVNAPATQMLATFCAVCGRPLVDAISVETGIGPECRRKHGYNTLVPEDVRAEANQLVHAIAVQQEGLTVAQAAARLRAIGFGKLADTIQKRVSDVLILDDGLGNYKVAFRYDDVIVRDFSRSVPGRRWLARETGEKMWFVPKGAKMMLLGWLKRNYQGAVIVGPKGPFTV